MTNPSTKTAGIAARMGGFYDELASIVEKKANLALAVPPPAQAMTQIKTTSPKPNSALKGSTASVSKPNTTPVMSPTQGHQPTLAAPQVKA